MVHTLWVYIAATFFAATGALAVFAWRLRRETRAASSGEAKLRSLIHQSLDMIGIVDPEGVVRYVSDATQRVLGYRPETLVGSSFHELVHPGDIASFRRLLQVSVRNPGRAQRGILRCRHSDGSWRHLESVLTNFMAEESVGGIATSMADVSERYTLQEQLTQQSFEDPLTRLPNRALFHDRLSHALLRAARRPTAVGVLFLDLDTFKVINESLGPIQGDRLLVAVGDRLAKGLRPEDTLARIGGDEFAVLLEDIYRPSDAALVAERVGNELRAPILLDTREFFVTASIGIVVDGGESAPEDVLRNADLAMYAAKDRGRACYALFDPTMEARASERLDMETDLRRGIPAELTVHYQPILDLVTGRIVECEALVRWNHPRRGVVTPGQFVRIAEETDLIFALGRFVLEEGCRQVSAWRRDVPGASNLIVSVNLSAKQLRHDNLVPELREILEQAGLPAHALKLEVTESVALQGADGAIARLGALRDLGIQIAIDDFGTGYSALTYLKRFPVDTLKVDRSFVNGIADDAQDRAIVGAVLAFARALDLDVTAEGIETKEQLTELVAFNCERGQGYYFARPMPGAEFQSLLGNHDAFAQSVALH